MNQMKDKTRQILTVVRQEEIAQGIYDLWLAYPQGKAPAAVKPGQFAGIYTGDPARLLPRPISICEYIPEQKPDGQQNPAGGVLEADARGKCGRREICDEAAQIRFVYRSVGTGTGELSRLQPGDPVPVLGILGNGYDLTAIAGKNVLLLGGGIGAPPLLGLAKAIYEADAAAGTGNRADGQLSAGTPGVRAAGHVTSVLGYRTNDLFLADEFAAFGDVIIATDDGTSGVHGNVIDAVREKKPAFDVICACGPLPMLRGVKQLAQEAGVPCYLSLEERMACGVGACLGCVVRTTKADAHSHVKNARVCTEGPVFRAEDVELGENRPASVVAAMPRQIPVTEPEKPDLSVTIAGVTLKNPIMSASGTFGAGQEYADFVDLNQMGAVVTKGVSNVPWEGNPTPRVAEVYGGMLNAIGLQNPGVEVFTSRDLPYLEQFDTKVIVNVCGHTEEEYLAVVERLRDEKRVDMLEINVSCPNVKQGGIGFGTKPEMLEEITKKIKAVAAQPVIMKLTPNVTSIAELAKAAEAGGADAISLINTITAMKIDVERQRFVLANKTGGLSGPAIHPVAVRMVYEAAQAVKIPIIGMGGVTTAEDALEMMLAGATGVAVGAATFHDPAAMLQVVEGIKDYAVRHHVEHIRDLIGAVHS